MDTVVDPYLDLFPDPILIIFACLEEINLFSKFLVKHSFIDHINVQLSTFQKVIAFSR
jgi:hypothetical protein